MFPAPFSCPKLPKQQITQIIFFNISIQPSSNAIVIICIIQTKKLRSITFKCAALLAQSPLSRQSSTPLATGVIQRLRNHSSIEASPLSSLFLGITKEAECTFYPGQPFLVVQTLRVSPSTANCWYRDSYPIRLTIVLTPPAPTEDTSFHFFTIRYRLSHSNMRVEV